MIILKIMLFVLWIYLARVSSLLSIFQPAKYARERYERTRNRTISKSIDVLETLTFMGIVNRYGYPAEEHVVTTADGYKLHIHRVPGSPARPKADGKPIILFQHGLLSSSDSWVLVGPTHDFAYMFADFGYDVWFGNVRGNTYCRSHIQLSPDNDPDFWQFSFHEMALYDMPAVIDYILRETNQMQLTYLGHSMGTTISYVLLSTRPEYNQKVKIVISMAPSAFWHEPLPQTTKFLKKNAESIKKLLTDAKIYEFFPLTADTAQQEKTTFTEKNIMFHQLCLNLVYNISAYDPKTNQTIIPYASSYFPAGASSQTVLHFLQNIESGDFKMYDYGVIQNFAIYGQAEPPPYNLNKIIAPVAIFYGRGDTLISPSNVLELSRKLQNLVSLEAVADDRFNHLDFLFSQNLKLLVNNPVMDIMNKIFPQTNETVPQVPQPPKDVEILFKKI